MPLTTGQYKTVVQKQNRDYYNRKTWENLLSQNQQSAIAAENQLVKDYTQASTAAYTSYLQNRANIESSALFGESKQKMLSENQLNLEEAYNTYRQNLAQNEQAVQKSYQEGASAIDEALTERAENFAAYENAAYDYTKYLFEKAPQLAADPRFANYFTQDAIWDETANEGKGDWERDEEGNIVYGDARLKTVDELYKDFYTYNEESGRYESNEDLTDYLDFVENYIGQGERPEGLEDVMSWEDYIRGTNPDLADYMFAGDPYNYTKEGTVAGSFRTLTGRESTDRTWSYAERITGVKAAQINKQYESFKSKYESAIKELGEGEEAFTDAKENAAVISGLMKEVGNMLNDYGLKETFERDLGMSFNDFADTIANNADKITSTGSWRWQTVAGVLGATTLGAVAGSAGGVAGGVIGGISSLASAISIAQTAKKENRAASEELDKVSKEAFNNILVAITKYAETQKEASANKPKSRLY